MQNNNTQMNIKIINKKEISIKINKKEVMDHTQSKFSVHSMFCLP